VRFCATNIRNSSRVLFEITFVLAHFDRVASAVEDYGIV
jgi:hypothetical protein